MIAVRLMGGLGNQMFQYAAARKLAHLNHTKIIFDMVFFDNIADVDTPREFELGSFTFPMPGTLPAAKRPPEPRPIYSGKKGRLRHASHRLQGKAWNFYVEPHHNFDPAMLKQPNGTYLVGWWQTEQYFSDIRPLLLKDFTLAAEPSKKNRAYLREIEARNSVSLHVRRSDYVSNPHANAFHGVKGKEYYDAALKVVTARVKNPTIFVISDDPAWCKANMSFDHPTVYVEGNSKGSEDMRLMMHCKHNIIANSSFSWWGAWLNQNPDKIAVGPKQWFNDPSVNTRDVLPRSWHAI